MKKNTVFKLVAISLPFAFIFLIEVTLRIIGYGENYELFHKVISENDTEYYVMNAEISKKYFRNTGFHSDNQSDLFLKHKTDKTYRIFVQGASTVVGFPFYKNASFPRLLKHRLSRTFPDRNIEVVNTGITAVNSYTLWDLTNKIIEKEPDLVIIYAGHNEYYGALGAGSSVYIGKHPTIVRFYLKIKNLRFFQLLENSYIKMVESNNESGYEVGETTLMEVMAREQQIPYQSEVYEAGIDQFRSNLKSILKKYRKNEIPVLLSTVVSNEKDVAPFISSPLNDKKFQQSLRSSPMNAGRIAENNAKAAYQLGKFYVEKNQDSAGKYFEIAKEMDQLRFRAPEKINSIIKELATEKNVHLVDAKSLFRSKSKSGFIDDELLTEHVHPNVKGNFILADAFYNKLKELNVIGDWKNYRSYDNSFQDIPVTRIDSIKGKMMVEDLKRSWPYELRMSGKNAVRGYHSLENPTYEERKAIGLYSGTEKWEDIMREAYHTYKNRGDYKNALRVAQSLISEFPEQHRVYDMAGKVCLEMNDIEYANFYFEKRDNLK